VNIRIRILYPSETPQKKNKKKIIIINKIKLITLYFKVSVLQCNYAFTNY